MSKQLLAAAAAALVASGGGILQAQSVDFGFNTPGSTDEWTIEFANGGPTPSVTQTDIGGEGYLRIENNGGFAQTGRLDFGATSAPLQSALQSTVDAAVTNGGTLSFDVLLRGDDQGDPIDQFFQVLVVTQDNQGNGFTQELIELGLNDMNPLNPGDVLSTTVTLDIVQGTAGTPEGGNMSDGIITYGGLSTDPAFTFRNLLIGTNTEGGRTTVLHIDNVRISAVPEPVSIGLVGSALVCGLACRRRR